MMTLYQHHLLSEVRIFEYSSVPTRLDTQAVVMDSVIIEHNIPTYCRSYYFCEKWLSVFVTFDEQLRLKPDRASTFPFVCNCDITTPHYCRNRSIFTTDLFIDVLVGADGRTYQLKDVEEFERAFARGLFGKGWYEKAKREVEWFVDLLGRNSFLEFLNEIVPFPTIPAVAVQPPMRRCHIDEIDFVYHPYYPRWE